MKRVLALAPLVLLVALAGAFYIALQTVKPAYEADAMVGRSVPAMTLPPLYEGTGDVTEGILKTGAPKLVNFWASWCAPCIIEHPELMKLQAAGVEIVGVNYKDTADAAKSFVEGRGDPFIAIGQDGEGRAGLDWGVTGVPETYVVDGEGRIVAKFAGPLTPNIVADIIEPALASVN